MEKARSTGPFSYCWGDCTGDFVGCVPFLIFRLGKHSSRVWGVRFRVGASVPGICIAQV